MRTDDLIAALAADTRAVPRAAPQTALALAAVAGGAIALLLVFAWLGVRPDLGPAASGGFFWIRVGYTTALTATFAFAAERLARPGLTPRAALALGGGIVALFVAAGVVQFLTLDSEVWMSVLKGQSWQVCTRNILVLGAPMTLIALWGLRSLAPTSPILAGAVCGLFSGALAATIYGLHCAEETFVFVGLWYTLGVLGCGLVGGLLGHRMLRW